MGNGLSHFRCRLPSGEEYSGNSGIHGSYPFLLAVPFNKEEGHSFSFPTGSTPRETHRRGVEEISQRLAKEREEGKEPGKTVLARVIMKETTLSADDIYIRLRTEYPEAFVFYFDSPETGTWIGASPELLCRKRGEKIETVALAGTRPTGTLGEWDTKNIEEQRIVWRYICGVLKQYCSNIESSPTYTRKAGPVEHLCTDISGTLLPETSLSTLLTSLSPTPALCGYPKATAMEEIKRLEMWPRGYYGGYVMLDYGNGDADIYVNLRSMRLKDGVAALYAGGGIMADSNPDLEWEETERKTATLLDILFRDSHRTGSENKQITSAFSGKNNSDRE